MRHVRPALKTPRLHGPAVRALRHATSVRAVAGVVMKQMRADHGIERLLSRPATARAPIGLHPFPLPAREPAQWEDARLGAPEAPAWRVTQARLRDALASGDVTPMDLLERVRTVVERGAFGLAGFSPFVAMDSSFADRAAEAAARRWKEGKPLSPIDGLPLPVKDEHHMRGLPTRGGARYLDVPVDTDSFVVSSLRSAGAVLCGKTHTTEWGMSPIGTSAHFPLPHNPRDADRAAGGSSTGSAVAVALGLGACAIGSDGGGSIRIPSALCGLYGIKPTFARLGTTGNIFGAGSVAVGGPMGQSVADLVDVLEVLAADRDPHDWLNQQAPKPRKGSRGWRRALGRGVRGARIGIPRSEWAVAEPAIRAAGEQALAALEADGAILVDLDLPLLADAPAVGVLSIASETVASLQDDYAANGERFGDDLAVIMHLMGALGAQDYLRGQQARAAIRLQVAAALRKVDVLALPTLPTGAPVYRKGEEACALNDDVATRAMCRFNFLANVTGLPAGTAPVGVHGAIPIGLQIIGDAWDEAAVFAVLAHLERLSLASDLGAPVGHVDLRNPLAG